MKCLIFRQSSLGDVILISSVIGRLRENIPDAQIDIFTKKEYAPLYQADRRINSVQYFTGDGDFLRKAYSLRSQRYDYLMDLQQNIRSHLLSAILAPILTMRYDKRRMARNAVVRKASEKLRVNHTIEAYLETIRPFGIDTTLVPPLIQLSGDDLAKAELLLGDFEECSPIIAICPGAKHFEKKWPSEGFAEVVRQLLRHQNLGIIVITSTGEGIESNLGIDNTRIFTAKDLDLPILAALLSLCDLSLTNDSGLMHLSESVGTPVLAIFGPTNPRLGFAPSLPHSRVICDDVVCSPCSVHGQKTCYQPEKYCFKEITPQRVMAQINDMLAQNR